MAGVFSYKCSKCEKLHEGLPIFSYTSPHHYACLDKAEKAKAVLTNNTCIIEGDRFIYGTLSVPVIGLSESFTWGVWVSLSKQNYEACVGKKIESNGKYFGWFCSLLPKTIYPETLHLKTTVHISSDGELPAIELEHTDHPLALDYHHGISVARAQELAGKALDAFSE